MEFKIKNKDLIKLQTIIDKLKINNMRINRGKAKFYSALSAKLQDYSADEIDILKEHVAVDEAGQFINDEVGDLVLKDGANAVKVNNLLKELQEEIIMISSGEYTTRFTDFFEWLADCEQDLTTDEAILIDDLLEQFEAQKGE